jgi:hypothetical protein
VRHGYWMRLPIAPYQCALMHALIAHFQNIAPTWLLLELDCRP